MGAYGASSNKYADYADMLRSVGENYRFYNCQETRVMCYIADKQIPRNSKAGPYDPAFS
jgi:hypothetical protein